ncbi:MAG: endonuclease V [Crenarchaeota archaeon]|nr:endonuclease V [Thermoproteota archaeon]MDW8034327.1 endonuclease V [Nitrososphaerota archaeon]
MRKNTMIIVKEYRLDQHVYLRLLKAQELISRMVVVSDEFLEGVLKIGGVDASYHEDLAAVGFSVYDLSRNEVTLISVTISSVKIPYVSTFFSFREGPIVLKALKKIGDEYDALLVNGHGLAHPRKCGLATYLGVVLKKPTIGVANNPIGSMEEEYNVNNLRMFEGKYYYSVGNMITLEKAYEILKKTTPEDSKLPIPLKVAHRISHKMLNKVSRVVERV